MCDSALVTKIALGLIPGVGDITARKLVSYCGGPEAVFRESARTLKRIPGIGDNLARAIVDRTFYRKAEEEAEYVCKHAIRVCFYLDDDYPYRLRQCEDSPVTFFCRGDVDLDAAHMLSVVGTRNATVRGVETTRKIIAGLSEHFPDLVIVSGLAYGIDIAAHKAAIANDMPTIAVLGHGLGTLYPSLHASVAKAILNNGALLTDFSSDTLPDRSNFIRRNRIIAGISDATLIVESGIRGGALITADIAASYNRDVMAVPGRTDDEWSSGCNAMIKRNKASLVETCSDIEYLMGWKPASLSAPVQKVLFAELAGIEKKVYEVLKTNGKMTLDQLAIAVGLPVHKLSTTLLQMELSGIVAPFPGSLYSIR